MLTSGLLFQMLTCWAQFSFFFLKQKGAQTITLTRVMFHSCYINMKDCLFQIIRPSGRKWTAADRSLMLMSHVIIINVTNVETVPGFALLHPTTLGSDVLLVGYTFQHVVGVLSYWSVLCSPCFHLPKLCRRERDTVPLWEDFWSVS